MMKRDFNGGNPRILCVPLSKLLRSPPPPSPATRAAQPVGTPVPPPGARPALPPHLSVRVSQKLSRPSLPKVRRRRLPPLPECFPPLRAATRPAKMGVQKKKINPDIIVKQENNSEKREDKEKR
ncbi:formin-like protein 19 [Solenopsis invicta]|uniref:formin-like protein 19 n=1 Tax=Solenopsis invicta TaxID=13686 RepID=UPI000595B963|nr:formin-like protein 19 [Solenopsis invicta]XP_039305234.1 formin-like protein 19 [Solenopsis invicta]